MQWQGSQRNCIKTNLFVKLKKQCAQLKFWIRVWRKWLLLILILLKKTSVICMYGTCRRVSWNFIILNNISPLKGPFQQAFYTNNGDFTWLQMSRSYRDISRWATIRIVSRRIDTVSIYRHIVSSLENTASTVNTSNVSLCGIWQHINVNWYVSDNKLNSKIKTKHF